jgi:hypothetical protein
MQITLKGDKNTKSKRDVVKEIKILKVRIILKRDKKY